jgi:hypothetical protein
LLSEQQSKSSSSRDVDNEALLLNIHNVIHQTELEEVRSNKISFEGNSINRKAKYLEESQQLRTFAQYLKVMRFVSDLNLIPEELFDDNLNPVKSNTKSFNNAHTEDDNEASDDYSMRLNVNDMNTVSKLQRRVISNIQTALMKLEKEKMKSNGNDGIQLFQSWGFDRLLGRDTEPKLKSKKHQQKQQQQSDTFEIREEVSGFGGVFPVDAAVFYRNDIISIIEVDGPHHYRYDGQLRRKDKLKELMYRRLYPDVTFHRIRWDEVDRIGFRIIGEEVANEIMEVINSRGGEWNYKINSFFRTIYRQTESFFSWGLRNELEEEF